MKDQQARDDLKDVFYSINDIEKAIKFIGSPGYEETYTFGLSNPIKRRIEGSGFLKEIHEKLDLIVDHLGLEFKLKEAEEERLVLKKKKEKKNG